MDQHRCRFAGCKNRMPTHDSFCCMPCWKGLPAEDRDYVVLANLAYRDGEISSQALLDTYRAVLDVAMCMGR